LFPSDQTFPIFEDSSRRRMMVDELAEIGRSNDESKPFRELKSECAASVVLRGRHFPG
jgi:hypothetical protein